MKRKLPIVDEASVVNCKLAKTNDLFQAIRRAIDSKENLSTYLGSGWISNVSDRNFIRWSRWKPDLSSEEKIIILYADLKVNVRIWMSIKNIQNLFWKWRIAVIIFLCLEFVSFLAKNCMHL